MRDTIAVSLLMILLGSTASVVTLAVTAPAAQDPDGVFTITPVQTRSCIAVKVGLTAKQALAGIRWYNNDDQTPFARILVASGRDEVPPLYADGIAVAEDVAGSRTGWSELTFNEPIGSQTDALYVVFELAADVPGVGEADGPGIGYVTEDGAPCVFLSADGDDWVRMRMGFRLLVDPILVARDPSILALSMSRPVTQEATDLPRVTALKAPFPNPFNPQVNIAYDLARPGDVRIKVFDIRGRLVRNLSRGSQPAGQYVVQWYGKDDNGSRVASGVYFVRLVADSRKLVRRVVMIK